MIISGYGIQLIRLTHNDIEMVRNWRNSAQIHRFMEYREYITPEMQEKWFASIDNVDNNYFLISYNGEKIGLINGSQTDWHAKETRSGGIFIVKEEYLKTLIPLRASLLLTDLSFIVGIERTFIKVLKDNPVAISYNKSLGYELLPGQENQYNQQYVITEQSYTAKVKKLKRLLTKGANEKIMFIIDDPGNEVTEFFAERIRNTTEENKSKVELKIINR
ncbi:MAG: hypothetical protein JWP12_3728 [Bacteroidetes bacterium]|nr:hypothetical protein [Bacteroidota bacterium]